MDLIPGELYKRITCRRLGITALSSIPHNRPQILPEDEAAVTTVLMSGWITSGPRVEALERRFETLLGGGGACAVSSGTAALFLALRDLGIGSGSRVALPTYACSALLNAVYMLGATPIVADIRADDFTIDPMSVSEACDALVAVHIYGAGADIAGCRARAPLVVEDCCQSLGGPQGREGDAAVYSFSATKIVTAGQGGLVWHHEKVAAAAAQDYRAFDCRETYQPRFNFLMPDINAALALSQMERLDAIRARRRAIRRVYEAARPAWIDLQSGHEDESILPYRYVLLFPDPADRDRAQAVFQAAGIRAEIPVQRFELLHRYLGLDAANFPVAERIVETTLSLPIFPALGEAEVARVAEVLEQLA